MTVGRRRADDHERLASTRRRADSSTPIRHRAITLRRWLRSASVPAFIFLQPAPAGKYAAADLIGNALPPEFVRRHALQIASTQAAPTTSRQSWRLAGRKRRSDRRRSRPEEAAGHGAPAEYTHVQGQGARQNA